MISTSPTVQMRRLVLLGSLLLFPVFSARGQSLSRSPGSDSLFRRARRMVSEGNGTAGRALVDSLLKGEAEGSKGYGDALYWHGALAETAADAERDYRRVIVEYPLSAYADDALLAIAELEQARLGTRYGRGAAQPDRLLHAPLSCIGRRRECGGRRHTGNHDSDASGAGHNVVSFYGEGERTPGSANINPQARKAGALSSRTETARCTTVAA